MTTGLGTNALHSILSMLFFSAGYSIVVSSTFFSLSTVSSTFFSTSVVGTISRSFGTNATALIERSFLASAITGASTTGSTTLGTYLTPSLVSIGASTGF